MLLARGSAMWPALLLVAASCHGVSAFLPAAPAARSPMAHLDARRAGVAQRRGRTPLTMVQTPPRQSVSIKELSKQMQSARLDMEQGEVDPAPGTGSGQTPPDHRRAPAQGSQRARAQTRRARLLHHP